MKWWPKFSITDLLWITVAVALGFAISQSPAPAAISGPFSQIVSDTRWPEGLQATGCLLLLFALIQHGRSILKDTSAGSAAAAFGIRWRWAVCHMLAAALAVLSTVRLLLNRKIIEEPEHADTFQVWDALWPDVLLSIVTLAAIRTFIARRPHRSIGASWRRIINVLSVVALFAYAVWVLTDRTLITMLVHIAIDGIEAAHPRWLQRPDVFPNHAMEGFWSFWTSTLAAVGVLVGMLLLVFDRWFECQRRQGIARFTFWGIVMSLAVFAWWFTYQEFPRIDPDLASPPSPRAWSDTLAGWLLYAAIATYLAAKSAQVTVDVANHQIEVSVNRTLVVVGAVFIAVAEVWFLIESVRVMHSISDIFGGGAFFDMMETFGQMLAWPETLLPLLVLASAVGLLWQSFRHPHATKTIVAISPRRFGYSVVAWAALLAVAIPALWAFAMCYWLGPLVL